MGFLYDFLPPAFKAVISVIVLLPFFASLFKNLFIPEFDEIHRSSGSRFRGANLIHLDQKLWVPAGSKGAEYIVPCRMHQARFFPDSKEHSLQPKNVFISIL